MAEVKEKATEPHLKNATPEDFLEISAAAFGGAGLLEEIVQHVAQSFRTFGGGQGSETNPVAAALKDKPLMFASGVSVEAVVRAALYWRMYFEQKPDEGQRTDEDERLWPKVRGNVRRDPAALLAAVVYHNARAEEDPAGLQNDRFEAMEQILEMCGQDFRAAFFLCAQIAGVDYAVLPMPAANPYETFRQRLAD